MFRNHRHPANKEVPLILPGEAGGPLLRGTRHELAKLGLNPDLCVPKVDTLTTPTCAPRGGPCGHRGHCLCGWDLWGHSTTVRQVQGLGLECQARERRRSRRSLRWVTKNRSRRFVFRSKTLNLAMNTNVEMHVFPMGLLGALEI